MRFLPLTFALMFLLAPALRAEVAGPSPSQSVLEAYRIAPEDVLEINVLDKPTLSKTITVMPDGMISYPYLGTVNIAGLTVPQVQARIVAALSRQLDQPQVTVLLVKRKEVVEPPARPVVQVSALGAVKNPGKRNLQENWHLLDLLVDCLGLTVDRPEWVTATLVRDGGSKVVKVDMTRLLGTFDPQENLLLEPGDVLLVQELDPARTQVQVLGEVVKPGPVPAPKDGSISAVLTAVGGPTARAALSRATILRGTQTIPVDLLALQTEGKLDGVRLEAGDTLMVPQNKLWFAVYGAVGKPGVQDYPEGQKLTVLGAMSQAGGQGQATDMKNVSLVRPPKDGKGEPTVVALNMEDVLKRGDLSKDMPVEPGDILYFPPKNQSGRFRLTDVLQYVPVIGWFVR